MSAKPPDGFKFPPFPAAAASEAPFGFPPSMSAASALEGTRSGAKTTAWGQATSLGSMSPLFVAIQGAPVDGASKVALHVQQTLGDVAYLDARVAAGDYLPGEQTGCHAEMLVVAGMMKTFGIAQVKNGNAAAIGQAVAKLQALKIGIKADAPACLDCASFLHKIGAGPEPAKDAAHGLTAWWNPITGQVFSNAQLSGIAKGTTPGLRRDDPSPFAPRRPRTRKPSPEPGAPAAPATGTAVPPEDIPNALRFIHRVEAETQARLHELGASLEALLETLVGEGRLPLEAYEGRRRLTVLRESLRTSGDASLSMNPTPDKYALKDLPQIDCEALLPLCKARCCSFPLALSAQDLDERVVRWNYGRPYEIAKRADGYCVHHGERGQCSIHPQRPAVCRTYDCRNDRRIWVDFEKRIPAP